MDALGIIKDARILTDTDWQGLTSLQEELRKTWETVQVFRTRTEMEVSVLNDMKRPTADAKYWQSVREQNVMFCELVNLSYEYRKKSVEIRKLQRNLDKEQDNLEKEILQIEMEQAEWHLRNMERTAHDRIREIIEWSTIKKELLPFMKYGTENVNDHQLEAMKIGFSQQAKLVNANTPIADARNIMGLADMAKKKGGNGGIRQIK